MKTWTLELTEDELIALAKVCAVYQEALLAEGRMTIEQLLTIQYIDDVSKKFPEEEWFSEEVRV